MLRYLNMFIIIGLLLIGVSIVGFATHDHFLMEPGQATNGSLSLIYLGAGVLMLINGLVSIRLAPIARPAQQSRPAQADSDRNLEAEARDGIVN